MATKFLAVTPTSTPAAQAFSAQSIHFDAEDSANPVIQAWRKRVYNHIDSILAPNSRILELNAGTGIDAIHFARQGHHVLATEVADGMVSVLQQKIAREPHLPIQVRQMSYEKIQLPEGGFDLIFSNFGGLNCTDRLDTILQQFPGLLRPGGMAVLVIMPPAAPWEWIRLLKGSYDQAFRRFRKNGTRAHLEGYEFTTWYYSVSHIRRILPPELTLHSVTGLGSFSPPPAATRFVQSFPGFSAWLEKADESLKNIFPFNRWADHLIVNLKSNELS